MMGEDAMKQCLLCLMMVLSGLFFTSGARAEALVVGVMSADRPPYFWKDKTGGYKGLFVDVLDELTKETDIHFSYKALPKARLRLYMVAGKIDVEMGIAKEWRQKKEELATSVYSIPFMESKEVYVTHSSSEKVDSANDVPLGDKFCGILGFSMPKGSIGKKRQDFLCETQLIKMIDKRRCDYTVMPYDIYRYLIRGANYSVAASAPISTHAMRVRLHKRNEWLLPRINAALKRIKQSGVLASLLKKYE